MSRSRKKFPSARGGSFGKFGKRWCNRKVRKAKGLYSGAEYRMVGSSWDIWDYKFMARPKELERMGWDEKKGYVSK